MGVPGLGLYRPGHRRGGVAAATHHAFYSGGRMGRAQGLTAPEPLAGSPPCFWPQPSRLAYTARRPSQSESNRNFVAAEQLMAIVLSQIGRASCRERVLVWGYRCSVKHE